MKTVKFYSGAKEDCSELLLGAVLDGVGVVAAYPIESTLDLPAVALELHKHVVKDYILYRVLDKEPNSKQYSAMTALSDAVGIKHMVTWNDLPDAPDYVEFRKAMLTAYSKS